MSYVSEEVSNWVHRSVVYHSNPKQRFFSTHARFSSRHLMVCHLCRNLTFWRFVLISVESNSILVLWSSPCQIILEVALWSITWWSVVTAITLTIPVVWWLEFYQEIHIAGLHSITNVCYNRPLFVSFNLSVWFFIDANKFNYKFKQLNMYRKI